MQSNETVVKQAQAAIERAARLDPRNSPIAMTFNEGTLTVDGWVPHIGAKKQVLRATNSVPGVTEVVDHLRMGSNHPLGDGATRDAVCKQLLESVDFQTCAIYAWVKGERKVLREAPAAATGTDAAGVIEVAVADGVVRLSGEVISLSHKRLAGVLAWWARGCRDVVNSLTIEPAEDDNDEEIIEALSLVLETDPMLSLNMERVNIACRDRTVTLMGKVRNEAERARIETDVWYIYGVEQVINKLEIA